MNDKTDPTPVNIVDALERARYELNNYLPYTALRSLTEFVELMDEREAADGSAFDWKAAREAWNRRAGS